MKPLEFSDCLADSPWYRQNLHTHEIALEEASKKIKNVEQHCRKIIHYAQKLTNAQRDLAKVLEEFKFETVGTTQTDDERILASCTKDFANLINHIENERMKVIHDAAPMYLDPLMKLSENIAKVITDEKTKFRKESNKFYSALDKNLHINTTRKTDFREADIQLGNHQKTFCKASLNYAAEIQAIQERLKFEFAEILSSFIYNWLSFYHVGHIIHEDYREMYDTISIKFQKARQNYESTISEAEELKGRMLIAHIRSGVFTADDGGHRSATSLPDDAFFRASNSNIKQGYLYREEKSILPSKLSRADVLPRTWNKYYCVFQKETRIFTMISVNTSTKTVG